MKKIIVLLTFLLISSVMYAQLTLSGEYRPRYEYQHGTKTLFLGQNSITSNITHRARLNLDFKNDNIKFGLQLQDVRTWGDVKTLNTTDDKFSIHQVWGEILFSENISLKLGRQELAYDNQRILGAVNWAQQARSHDLALLKLGLSDNTKLDVGLAINQADAYVAPYENMQYGWFHSDIDDLGISLLAMNLGIDNRGGDGKTYNNQTLGTHLTFQGVDKLNLLASLYYQMGAKNKDVDFSALQFMIGAALSLNDNFGLHAAFEHLSGDDFDTDDKQEAFTPWFGTNHKFNGWMDYFYVGNHFYSVGLNDVSFGVKYKKDKASAGITGHYFTSATDIQYVTNDEELGTENSLGTELDAFFGYKINKDVLLKIGASYLMPAEGMELLKLGYTGTGEFEYDKSNYDMWIMFVINPTFFTTAK